MKNATVILSHLKERTSRTGACPRWATTMGLIVGLSAGFATTGFAEENSAVKQGKEEYMAHCASCHGATGEGDGPVAGSLKNKPPNLTFLHQQETDGAFPTQRVMEIIQGNKDYDKNFRTHGPADMPVWGKVFYEESGERSNVAKARIRNLVDYIKSIQK
ncbi:MAG: cytochrome c [Porticoccaceae bacterium]